MSDRGVCVVTGGSRGIGAATVRLAAGRGYAVALTYRERADEAQRVVADVEAAGGRATAICADVADEAAMQAAFATADALGPLTLLVNNAGIVGDVGRVEDVQVAMLERLVRINVVGAFIAAREAVRRMSTKRGGRGGSIVNVSSGASQLGSPNVWVHYAATKGALDTMTIGLAKEVAGEGIRVNAVRPGIIDTEIHASGGTPDRVREITPQLPMKRAGTADEVGEAIVWLLSHRASYTTGSIVEVTGGR